MPRPKINPYYKMISPLPKEMYEYSGKILGEDEKNIIVPGLNNKRVTVPKSEVYNAHNFFDQLVRFAVCKKLARDIHLIPRA